jgi:hypothetical protein
MHRSGTSAVAHSAVELGLSTPDSDDLIAAGPYNEHGYWESRTISQFDERVLRHLGGTWSAPPRISADWEESDDATMVALRSQAAELAAASFARPPMVMKDPRLCLTLPLWRTVLTSEPVAVLVFREPLEVALSLQERDGFPPTLGLALWHRYVRQSLVSLVGLPVLVVEYARALNEPHHWVDDLVAFLGDNGITPGADRSDQATRVLAHDLRHHRTATLPVTLESEQQPLLEILRSSLGGHDQWSIPELPAEPSWVEDVISLTLAGQAVAAAMQAAQQELKWVKQSRLFRATSALWRMTGTGPVLSPADEGSDAADSGPNGTATAAPAAFR